MNWHFEGKYNLSGKDYSKESKKNHLKLYNQNHIWNAIFIYIV